MIVLQINTQVNSGSTGRHAENTGRLLLKLGHQSYIAYGRGTQLSKSNLIHIGNKFHHLFHLVNTRFFDLHGLGSTIPTKKFIHKIENIKPDVIHLRNIHGYYINYRVLFRYLASSNYPVVWTLHDCWPFTGHCSHFEHINCFKWQTECQNCPNKHGYPESWFIDNSRKNYHQKKNLFTLLNKMILVAPSIWMKNYLEKSFLSKYEIRMIYNGIDINKFRITDSKTVKVKYNLQKKYVLAVANVWTQKKGLSDLLALRKLLKEDIEIVLVGLNRRQQNSLPTGIKGIMRTENIDELAAIYSTAEVFVNPTYADNFPTTNLESLACGTPVITYNTGGSPEAIDENTGIVVEKGNIQQLARAIKIVVEKGKEHYKPLCRERAIKYFNKDERFMDYIRLYETLISG